MSLQRWVGICGLVAAVCVGTGATTAAPLDDLLRYLPDSANALVVIDVERVSESPLAVKEGWGKKDAVAYVDHPMVLPADTSVVVIGAQIDMVTVEAQWQVGILAMDPIPSMEVIAKAEGGQIDSLATVPAVRTPIDVYFIQLAEKVLGVAPADRQFVTRWIRTARARRKPGLPAYLTKAADLVSKGKADLVMAIDLQDVANAKELEAEFKNSKELVKMDIDLAALGEVVASIRGATLAVTIGDRPAGKAVITFGQDVAIMKDFAHQFVIETIREMGAHIEDFNAWETTVKGKTITLAGPMTATGLRQLTSVMELPTPQTEAAAEDPEQVPMSTKAEASLKHFKVMRTLLNDLRSRSVKDQNFEIALWFMRYADRIDRLPILNVDSELLDYSSWAAERFREAAKIAEVNQAAIAAKTAGYRSNLRYQTRGHGYRNRWGGYGGHRRLGATEAARKQEQAHRDRVKAQTRAQDAEKVIDIVKQIEDETAKVRRQMTERYQIEF